MAYNVVLVTGYAQTGKDTVGKALAAYNPKFITLSFAEPLKRAANAAMRALGVNDIDFFNEEDKKKYREVLVAIGRSARDKDEDVFVKILSQKIDDLIALGYIPVVTDWRYINEYRYIANKFGEGHVKTVWVRKIDEYPAHHEEMESIKGIRNFAPMNHTSVFPSGDVESINKWSREIADTIL